MNHQPHHHHSSSSSSSLSLTSKPLPPPLPPKLPNTTTSSAPLRHKISLPSFNSASSFFSSLASSSPPRHAPPVPPLPNNYVPPTKSSLELTSLNHQPPHSSGSRNTPPHPAEHHLPNPNHSSRPLPHLPHSQPHPPTTHPPHVKFPSFPEPHLPPTPPLHPLSRSTNSQSSRPTHSPPTRNKSSGIGGGVPYTNILHDYDMPLGAHSIPTKISTRPINFTSSAYSSNQQLLQQQQQQQQQQQHHHQQQQYHHQQQHHHHHQQQHHHYQQHHSYSPPSSSSSASAQPSQLDHPHRRNSLKQEDHPRGPINPSDASILPSSLDDASDKTTLNQPDDDCFPLQIYTTRPSLEMQEASSVPRHRRSTSVHETKRHLTPSDLKPGLSVEHSTHRNLSISGGDRPSAVQSLRPDLAAASKPSNIILEPGFDVACLSHLARFLIIHLPRDTKIKRSIEYPMSFTGRDTVTTITHCLNRVNPSTKSTTQATLNRRLALSLSRTLLAEKFFHEVTHLNHHEVVLSDNIDDVYVFPQLENNQSQDPLHHQHHHHHSWLNPQTSFDNQQHHHSSSFAGIPLPQGILTQLTKCYSFNCQYNHLNQNNISSNCTSTSICYSYDCPSRKTRSIALSSARNLAVQVSNLEASSSSPTTATATVVAQTKDWASIVSKELISSLDSKEIARQSIIHEVISGEQDYVQDLDDYEKLFIIPLLQANPTVLPPQRLTQFKEKVISNVLEIRNHNRVLLQNLLIRQQDQHPLVHGIGDILLNSALEWGTDYIRYTRDHVFGEVEVNDEKHRNPMFAELINKIPKLSSRRADFKHYYSRAFVRLQRYNLLLESLLRKTPEGHDDRASIESAMDVIKRQCKDADLAVSSQQAKLQLVRLNNEIIPKPDTPDLQLLSPNRQMIFSGRVLRKPDGGTGLSEWSELHAILFDHYFVLTKVKRIDENSIRYPLSRPPILLELMRVTGFNDPCERKSRGLRTITGTLGSNGGLERGNSDPYSSPSSQSAPPVSASGPNSQDDRWLYPITIQSLGRHNFLTTVYVESERARLMWKTKFEEAIGLRMQILDSFKVFDLYPITDQTFAASGSVLTSGNSNATHANGGGQSGSSGSINANSAHYTPPNRNPTVGETISNMHGPPTCSVPFRSLDGKKLVAIGCMDGLWIGLRNDPSSMKQVIFLKSITQCAVLQEFGFLLVLAEKILMAYPLESLIPSRNSISLNSQNSSSDTNSKGPVRAIASRLSGNKDVLFFRCGKVGPRTLVIYVKKGGVNQTVFKALEPVRNSENATTLNRRGFFGIGNNKSNSFRGYKEFFVPSESYSIQYLRNTITIHCARGFEIMNIDTLKTASIPDFNQIKQQDHRLLSLQRRCDESRPLGMFRLGDNEFLLCYDEFAFFADKHGDPLVDRYNSIMEWEGRPSSVAYNSPYIICFSSMMIEVWNTLTSKRVQIILGENVVCTYDGGALGDDGSSVGKLLKIDSYALNQSHHDDPSHIRSMDRAARHHEDDDQEADRRIHVMMKDLDQFYRVFELVPLTLR